MLNTWYFNVIIHLIIYCIFTQTFRLLAKNTKNEGALTILLQLFVGLSILFFVPFFPWKISNNINIYIMLGISIIF